MEKKYYVATIPLIVNTKDSFLLQRVFKQVKECYNAIQNNMLKQYQYITSSNNYKNANIKEQKKILKNYTIPIKMNRGGILEKKIFDKYGVISVLAGRYGKYYPLLNSQNTKAIANNCYNAWDAFIFGDGKNIHLKKDTDILSLQTSVSNGFLIGMNFNLDNNIIQVKVNKHILDLQLKFNNTQYDSYVQQQINNKEYVCVSIISKPIRNTIKYELHLTLKGVPYNKARKLGVGKVGVDIGTSSVTSYGTNLDMSKLSNDELLKLSKQIRRLNRKLDRSRRIMNPLNYNEDGTIKEGDDLIWKTSNNYITLSNKKKNLFRKAIIQRKTHHLKLANSLLALGDEFNIEKNNIKSWSEKPKKTVINEKTGKFKSKKRFGKSVLHNAPSEFLNTLKFKVLSLGGKVNDVSTKLSATQFDFTSNEFKKHKLNERKVQLSNNNFHTRDAIAAFNLKHIKENIVNEKNINNYDIEKMNEDYVNFCKHEKEEIQKHMIGEKLTTHSMGI